MVYIYCVRAAFNVDIKISKYLSLFDDVMAVQLKFYRAALNGAFVNHGLYRQDRTVTDTSKRKECRSSN